jgi:hypothetical protein
VMAENARELYTLPTRAGAGATANNGPVKA